jgi:chemotaxis protein CheX
MPAYPHPAFPLPATLDTSAATPLRHALLAGIERGEPLRLNGAEVVRVGQACLQVLASGRATASDRGLGFRIDDPSDALTRMIQLARLDVLLDPAAGAVA